MRTTLIICFFAMVIISNNACKAIENEMYSENNHPVRKVYLSSIEAFNQGDLELFLANFAPHIKMYGTDGNYFGKDALRDRFEKVLQQFPDVRMEIPELKLEILSADAVLVHFKWKVFPMGQGPAFSGIGSGLYQKTDGVWNEILEVEKITFVDEELQQR